MMTVHLGEKDRAVSMRFIAVREFHRLTGRYLGKTGFTDIFGNDASYDEKGNVTLEAKEFNPELFLAFLWSILLDGGHPEKPDYTIDDVASWVTIYNYELQGQLFELWMTYMTGKSKEEVRQAIEKLQAEKNRIALQDRATQDQISSGGISSESPTASSG